VAHPFGLAAVAGTSVLLRGLMQEIPDVEPRLRGAYLDLGATADPAATVAEFSATCDGALRFLGVNTHIEQHWERSLACYELCQRKDVPAFVWIHDYWPHHGASVRLLDEELGVTLLASTPTVRDGLVDDGFRARVVQVGIPLANLDVRTVPAAAMAPFVVGTAGRLVRRKRQADVVRAFEGACLGEGAELRLRLLPSLVYSSTDDAAVLAEVTGPIGAIAASGSRVVVQREASELHRYAAYSVFVCASDYEGFSLTPVEAIYCGCPALMSDIPAHREIASVLHPDDRDEVLFPCGDVARLAELLRDEARSGRRRTRLQARAHELRALIEARWSLQDTARGLVDAVCRTRRSSSLREERRS
jgi:glycosyltransferase involved in cell wall biosynthesis